MADVRVRVVEVVEEAGADRTYVIEVEPSETPFAWTPGQYTSLLDPAAEEPKARWYSISSADRGDRRFEVSVRAGSVEDALRFGFRVGQVLVATAPAGDFVLAYEPADHLLLVAAGSGITPFRAFAQHLRDADPRPRVTLVHSDRSPSTLLFRSELERYAQESWLCYEPRVTSDDHGEPWTGATGRVTADDVSGWIEDPARTTVYACGPAEFVDAVLAAAGTSGVPSERLRREGWG